MEQGPPALVAKALEEVLMKFITAIGIVSSIALTAASPAGARQGCGPGFHRAPNGMCRPNRNQQVFVVGRYYAGHGYWYNNRWWRQRYRYHNGWRYR
jgi:hypothetical protein